MNEEIDEYGIDPNVPDLRIWCQKPLNRCMVALSPADITL